MTYVSDWYEKHPEAAKRLKALGEKNKKSLKKKEVSNEQTNGS